MSALTLGQPVTITDYLVRGDLSAEQVVKLSTRWAYLPTIIAEKAQQAVKSSTGYRYAGFRIWIPASLESESYRDGLNWISTKDRTHPNPTYSEMKLPLSGIVTQKVQVQDGQVEHDYDVGAVFIGWSVQPGYRVAYHLSRRPVLVLPSMIEEAA